MTLGHVHPGASLDDVQNGVVANAVESRNRSLGNVAHCAARSNGSNRLLGEVSPCAYSLSAGLPTSRDSVPSVIERRTSTKMIRSTAGWIVAGMKHLMLSRHWTKGQLVGNSVCAPSHRGRAPRRRNREGETAISLCPVWTSSPALPQPATRSFLDLRPKLFRIDELKRNFLRGAAHA